MGDGYEELRDRLDRLESQFPLTTDQVDDFHALSKFYCGFSVREALLTVTKSTSAEEEDSSGVVPSSKLRSDIFRNFLVVEASFKDAIASFLGKCCWTRLLEFRKFVKTIPRRMSAGRMAPCIRELEFHLGHWPSLLRLRSQLVEFVRDTIRIPVLGQIHRAFMMTAFDACSKVRAEFLSILSSMETPHSRLQATVEFVEEFVTAVRDFHTVIHCHDMMAANQPKDDDPATLESQSEDNKATMLTWGIRRPDGFHDGVDASDVETYGMLLPRLSLFSSMLLEKLAAARVRRVLDMDHEESVDAIRNLGRLHREADKKAGNKTPIRTVLAALHSAIPAIISAESGLAPKIIPICSHPSPTGEELHLPPESTDVESVVCGGAEMELWSRGAHWLGPSRPARERFYLQAFFLHFGRRFAFYRMEYAFRWALPPMVEKSSPGQGFPPPNHTGFIYLLTGGGLEECLPMLESVASMYRVGMTHCSSSAVAGSLVALGKPKWVVPVREDTTPAGHGDSGEDAYISPMGRAVVEFLSVLWGYNQWWIGCDPSGSSPRMEATVWRECSQQLVLIVGGLINTHTHLLTNLFPSPPRVTESQLCLVHADVMAVLGHPIVGQFEEFSHRYSGANFAVVHNARVDSDAGHVKQEGPSSGSKKERRESEAVLPRVVAGEVVREIDPRGTASNVSDRPWISQVARVFEECNELAMAAVQKVTLSIASRIKAYFRSHMKRQDWRLTVPPTQPNTYVSELISSVVDDGAKKMVAFGPSTRCPFVSHLITAFIQAYLESVRFVKPSISRHGGARMAKDMGAVKDWVSTSKWLHDDERTVVFESLHPTLVVWEAVCQVFTADDVTSIPKNDTTNPWLAMRK
eukprot:Rmarinus@m.4285